MGTGGADGMGGGPDDEENERAPFAVASHDVLFGGDEDAGRCDVCGIAVGEDAGEGHAVPGSALYVWTRGEEVRRQEPPLCPSCAAALGLSALGRWEIEEEEG